MMPLIKDAAIAMGVCAALFVLFAVLRPMRSCSGHCGGCAADCELKDREIQ